MSYLSHLQCSKCDAHYSADAINGVCACGAPLLARYDLAAAGKMVTPRDLVGRPASLWRYHELLPIRKLNHVVTMGEGYTPLWPARRLGQHLGFERLWLKDEGINPSGTFKARGAAVAISRAAELGVRTVAMPTAGNAGGAWAMYCARAGMQAVVVMPEDAEELAIKECVVARAQTYLVRGLVSDAAAIISRAAKRHGWFEATTLKEPYRIEGKKTMGYEIAEQLGWRLPDAVLCPTGGGVGIISIFKAFEEMLAMNWVRGTMPKLIAVQAAGCDPIVKAFTAGAATSVFHERAATVASGLRVPKALGDFLVLEAVRKTDGSCISIDDKDILAAIDLVGRLEGAFICPEGASVVHAAAALLAKGVLQRDQDIVLLNTGTGLKYSHTVSSNVKVLSADSELAA